MSPDLYREYLDHIIHVDRYANLRSLVDGLVLAATKAQCQLLIEYLGILEARVGESSAEIDLKRPVTLLPNL